MNKELTRETVLIAFFGALWGVMEITLGVFLKGLRLPFAGELLTALASIIALTGRYYINQKWSILLMAMVAAVIKLFSLSNVILGPFMAIILEGLIAELMILMLGTGLTSFIITSAMMQLYTVVHPFIAQGIIYGKDVYKIYIELIEQGKSLFGLNDSHVILIAVLYTLLHMSIGIPAGMAAWSFTKNISKRLASPA